MSEKNDAARSQSDQGCEFSAGQNYPQNPSANSLATHTTVPVIDFDKLLSRGIDEEIIKEIVPLFIANSKHLMEKLVVAVNADDLNKIISYAHTIKGSAANIAAEKISQAALELERAVAQKDLTSAQGLLELIISELERLESFISNPNWFETAGSQHNRNEPMNHLN